MTAATLHGDWRERALDRLGELASIGAGHAAGALATLVGRPVEMRVPLARILGPDRLDAPLATQIEGEQRAWAGVLFDVLGGPGGTLALLLPPAAGTALLSALLGASAWQAAAAESALCEVGNIVASHALSAMSSLQGERMLPSPPRFVARDAPAALAQALAARGEPRPLARVEVELSDRAHALRALLVWVPDAGA
jgi:chemotaxis protein CheC